MSLPTLPPMRVPTLTEVVDWPPMQLVVAEEPAPVAIDELADGGVEVRIDESAELTIDPPPAPPIDEAALTQRLLADLQTQVDAMLDQQLRVAMQPLLNRLADTLALQARDELASALRDMVALAVSREMIRLRATAPPADPG